MTIQNITIENVTIVIKHDPGRGKSYEERVRETHERGRLGGLRYAEKRQEQEAENNEINEED